MNYLAGLLLISFPVLALAQYDFIAAGGEQPYRKIVLADERVIWAHGCYAGSLVTYKSSRMLPGTYKTADTTITIDENSRLSHDMENCIASENHK